MADLSKLITRISTISELKQLFIEIFLNNTDKVSKVSDGSVLNAVSYGIAKIAQKSIKDVAIVESLIFPESASGVYLDRSALLFSGLIRLGAEGSSTFVRVKASSGTTYIPGVHTFSSSTGIQFEVTEIVTVGVNGFDYVPVRSINIGQNSNVAAMTINSVTPTPIGHTSCTNEYKAVGGRDVESDESFKIRVGQHPNLLSKSTLDSLLEVMRGVDPNILRIFKMGIENGQVIIRIVRENGALLTDSEIADLLSRISPSISLVDSFRQGDSYGLKIENISWRYIDMDFRAKISTAYVIDDVREKIQIAISKYLDFRYWVEGNKVEWDDLLQIVKNTEGVEYVPDEFFIPGEDVGVLYGELPRVRGFILRNIDNGILFNSNSALTPVFYENGI